MLLKTPKLDESIKLQVSELAEFQSLLLNECIDGWHMFNDEKKFTVLDLSMMLPNSNVFRELIRHNRCRINSFNDLKRILVKIRELKWFEVLDLVLEKFQHVAREYNPVRVMINVSQFGFVLMKRRCICWK